MKLSAARGARDLAAELLGTAIPLQRLLVIVRHAAYAFFVDLAEPARGFAVPAACQRAIGAHRFRRFALRFEVLRELEGTGARSLERGRL